MSMCLSDGGFGKANMVNAVSREIGNSTIKQIVVIDASMLFTY